MARIAACCSASITDSLDEVSQKYVQIDDVIVREVELPPQVNKIIEEKMMHKERAASFEYRLDAERKEAERKEIEANGFRALQRAAERFDHAGRAEVARTGR